MAASADFPNAPTRIVCVLGAGLVAGGLIVKSSQALGLLVVSVFALLALALLCSTVTRWPEDRAVAARIFRWTVASFALHLVVGLLIINSSLLNFLGPDALTYDGIARAILSHWSRGLPMPRVPGGKEGFYYLLASIYWMFGPSKWAGVAFNAMLAAALIPIVCDTAYRLFGSAPVKYVPYLFVFVPGMLLWPSQLLKEAPYLFLLAAAANCASRLIRRYSPLPLMILVVLLPALLLFRAEISLAVLAGTMAGVALGRRRLGGGLVGGLVASALVAVVVASGVGSSGYQVAVTTDLEKANAIRGGLSVSAASSFNADADISTTKRALSFLPRGAVSVIFGPFPWQLRGGRQGVVLPDVAAWWLLVAGFWWGLRAARRVDRRWVVAAVPAAATTAVLALSVGNYGILVRERMQILVLVAPIVALGFAARRADRSARLQDVLIS